jgi:hypothetical protein
VLKRHGWDIHALSTELDRVLAGAEWDLGQQSAPDRRWFNIGQLTDVSVCKLQQYF